MLAVVVVAESELVGYVLELMVQVRLVLKDRWVRMDRTVQKAPMERWKTGSVTAPAVLEESRLVVRERWVRSAVEHHSPRCVASHRFAARDCTSVHRYSFPVEPHQTRIRSTACSLWGVGSTRTLRGS